MIFHVQKPGKIDLELFIVKRLELIRSRKGPDNVRSLSTLHLNGKNLLNNSSWGFEHIFDTRNSYRLCPGQNYFSRTLVFFVNPG